MFVDPVLGRQLIYAGKLAGAISAIVGCAYFGSKALIWVIKKITDINENVHQVVTKHLPHIQKTLEDQDVVLGAVKSDVRDLGTKVEGIDDRLTDTRTSVHTLGESFVRHLETSARELVEARSETAKNELDIAAIKAAQKIFDDASTAAKNLMETTKKKEI